MIIVLKSLLKWQMKYNEYNKEKKTYIVKIAFRVLFILLFFLFVYTYRIEIINGDSMTPTIKDGQIVLAQKNVKKIAKNDIIFFKEDGQEYVKRVVGIPGDDIIFLNSKIYIDSKEYINTQFYDTKKISHLYNGEYFVLGDNAENSIDSRTFGCIKKSQILATVVWY